MTNSNGDQKQLDALLFRAIRSDDAKQVSALLRQGANPNSPDRSFVSIAAKNGKLAPKELPTALLVAIDWRYEAEPLRRQDHLYSADYEPRNPPKENIAIIEALLEHGAKPNVRNQKGCTPLMLAAWQGKSKSVALLLKFDHQINAQDPDGYTSLMYAVVGEDLATVKTLVAAKADINTIKETAGFTALTLAAARKETTIEALLRQTLR